MLRKDIWGRHEAETDSFGDFSVVKQGRRAWPLHSNLVETSWRHNQTLQCCKPLVCDYFLTGHEKVEYWDQLELVAVNEATRAGSFRHKTNLKTKTTWVLLGTRGGNHVFLLEKDDSEKN